MEEKYTAYIYGAGNLYNRLINHFRKCKDSLKILGIVTSLPTPYKEIDGYDCFTVENVDFGGVDFVIIAVEKWREIFHILLEKGVSEESIIRGSVFELTDFDFEEYVELKRSSVSILSNCCLGGMVYKKLGLKVTSPTINMYCAGQGYLKFLRKYEYYMNCEMKKLDGQYYIDGTLAREAFYLRGILGNEIIWNFNHSSNAHETIAQWNEHKARLNYANIAVIMTIQSDEDAFRFEELKIEKKLGIYYKQLDLEHVVYIPEWQDNYDAILKYDGNWTDFANDYMMGANGYIPPVNWIKFLLGDSSFQRKTTW